MLRSLVARIGVLRILLVIVALGFMLASLFTGDAVYYSGWRMLPTLIIPAVAPIVFFVILLDLMMAAVFMAEKQGAERAHFVFIIKMDVLLVIGMLVFWLPYFLAIATVE